MLPTKKMFITFCRSPHVDKLSMEQFVRYTHKRMFYINSSSSEIKDFIKEYADMPSGVTVNIHFEGGKE
jgi:ribosomal protein S10